MSAYTKGPWTAKRRQRASNFGGGRVDIEDGQRRTVARAIYGSQTIAIPEDEAEANARLIAAAPLMAQALRDCAAALSTQMLDGCTHEELNEARTVARDALATAGVAP